VGYPERAIRTREYLYVINFRPERWPMGDPPNFYCHTKMSNPTKDFILEHQDDEAGRWFFEKTYAKRGSEELYHLPSDPDCLTNLAGHADYLEAKAALREKLLGLLAEQGDPRVLGYGDIFDSYPYWGRIQPELSGFNAIGKYNEAYWPFEGREVPRLNTGEKD
jgi:hypothetical protein